MPDAEKQTSGGQWTEGQREAISTTGRSLLVSAAAGSGKTSVLAERCVFLLCDAEVPCEVGDLLVVTFTEAAAAEMKARIARSLSARHSREPGERTARHLAMLDRATISTLHGFCARVLRQNFHLMGLDPEFRILDEDEASLLRLDVARELFDERYDDPEDENFRQMVDCYAEGQDERLIAQVIRAYSTLCSVVDPARWLHEARHRIELAIDLPLEKSELGEAYLKMIRAQLTALLNECADAAATIKKLKHFDAYVQHLRELWATLRHWLNVFESHGLDALAEESGSVELPKLKPVSNSIEGKEIAKARIDSVRKNIKEGPWRKNLLFSTDEWKEGLRQTLGHVDVFLSLVADFAERYTRMKDADGAVDFADLEQLTLRSLKLEGVEPITPSALARNYQYQFKQVLVDEYQDINEVQDAILSLLSRECLKGGGNLESNLFCVGDVKQSIYRFRLAEAKQFLDRRAEYLKAGSHGKVIDLQTNFRSRGPLLGAINAVFERLMTKEAADLDYDESQKLRAGQSFPDVAEGFVGSPVELHVLAKEAGGGGGDSDEIALDRTQREAVVLGRRILEMVGRTEVPARQVVDRGLGGGTGGKTRPVRFGDIVILLRSMRYKGDQFAITLRSMGVAVHTESVTGYFEATEVNDVLSLLHVLDNQRQDIHLAALLRSPLVQLEDAESNLARIRLAFGAEPAVPFHLAVQRYAEEKQDELGVFLRNFRSRLQGWRAEVRQRPVAEMLWNIYNETGYLAYVSGLPNGEQRQANLIELHDRAQQFGTFHRQGLGRFLTFLEKLKAETDLGQASIASEAEDVVRIMSIHRSKGQEFPVVLLPDLGKAINLQDTQGSILLDRGAGLGLAVIDPVRQIRYPSLASTIVQERLKQQALAEELRVLYVAMTRAKEHLILAGTVAEAQPDKWRQQWAGHSGPLPAEEVLSARTVLDWVGPVAAIVPDQFEVQMHAPRELEGWMSSLPSANALTELQKEMADLQPLVPVPEIPVEAEGILEGILAGLNGKYAFGDVADRAAAVSVTGLSKNAGGEVVGAKGLGDVAGRSLNQPGFLTGQTPVSAADIGTATHAVLEHFSFDGQRSIEEQIAGMVQSRRLSEGLSGVVDRGAIEWFLGTEVARTIRENAGRVHREVPVYFSNLMQGELQSDPNDLQMVRGRVDLLVETERGWMIVDYKTDRVSGLEVEQRAASYAGQLEEYRKAIRRITGKEVVECAIVFLAAREVRRV
jgi:ATP-dependent helicase/nuclease subunit A